MILNIYIIEDDIAACDRFRSTAEYMNDIIIDGFTDNAHIAYEYIINNNPDAIILDLELEVGNGPELLEKLNQLPTDKRPYVIITTNNSNPITIDYLHKNSSGYIFFKYKPNYSEYEVLNFLRMFKTSIYNYRNNTHIGVQIQQNDIISTIMADIDKHLRIIGVSEKISGYKHLKDAIFYVMKDSYNPKMLTELSKSYNCTPKSIEHNMRYAIKSTWAKYKSVEEIKKVYSGHVSDDMNPPSIGEFVSHYAETLKNRHISLLNKLK